MKVTNLTLILLFLIATFSMYGQQRIAINGIDVINTRKFSIFSGNSGDQVLKNVPTYCVDFFANNNKFVTIDRKNINIIASERELQKSEDFIDGYMVEQGKSEGVDLMLKALYYEDKELLNIKIYDIAEGAVKCYKEAPLESNILGVKNLEKKVTFILHDLMWECFGTKFTVVRLTDEKDKKAKEVLVAVGKKHKVEEDDKVEFFEIEEIDIDGEIIVKRKILCDGEIDEVVDSNFSKIKTKGDREKLADALANDRKVYCTIRNPFY